MLYISLTDGNAPTRSSLAHLLSLRGLEVFKRFVAASAFGGKILSKKLKPVGSTDHADEDEDEDDKDEDKDEDEDGDDSSLSASSWSR